MESEGSQSYSRQLPGLACEECRRRKLRCDRGKPRCRVCIEAGIDCTVNSVRRPRGPKKGNSRTLNHRISAVASESHLQELRPPRQQSQRAQRPGGRHGQPWAPYRHAENQDNLSEDQEQNESCDSPDVWSEGTGENPAKSLEMHPESEVSMGHHAPSVAGSVATPNTDVMMLSLDYASTIPDVMAADLDQLYFDRVHHFIPILNRRKFMDWSYRAAKSSEGVHLRYAMWALAASMSSQFQEACCMFYQAARRRLDELEYQNSVSNEGLLQQAQSWILLALYDTLRTQRRQGWLNAGRSNRLIQLMRLYELDGPGIIRGSTPPGNTPSSGTKLEEGRRVFWMAFCLDRFASTPEGWPLTMEEHMIFTRLPTSNSDFQANRLCKTLFLPEILGSTEQPPVSPFSDCIAMAAMYGRALKHQEQSAVERACGSVFQDFWDRHNWLDAVLTNRIQALFKKIQCCGDCVDPVLSFANMVAQATMLSLYKTMRSMELAANECRSTVLAFEQRSLDAADKIVASTAEIRQGAFFHVHPFAPLPLCICADFFKSYQNLHANFNAQLLEVLKALQHLRDNNKLAEDYLEAHVSTRTAASAVTSSPSLN